MRGSTRERMFNLVRQWQGSGLSQKDFCEKKDIVYATFHYWYKKYREADQSLSVLPSFTPVTMPLMGSDAFCTVRLQGGVQIDFHTPVSPAYLNQLGK